MFNLKISAFKRLAIREMMYIISTITTITIGDSVLIMEKSAITLTTYDSKPNSCDMMFAEF